MIHESRCTLQRPRIVFMHIVTLSGSPSSPSRSAALLRFVERRLAGGTHTFEHIAVRELPPQALLLADAQAPELRAAIAEVLRADLLIVATPIYKAAYSGLLKTFLDLLPPDALRGKTLWPLATGGSPAHLLALEYALKPVLAALGARDMLDAVYVLDREWRTHDTLGPIPLPEVIERIDAALRGRTTGAARSAAPVAESALAPC
jgi:FMN reductase